MLVLAAAYCGACSSSADVVDGGAPERQELGQPDDQGTDAPNQLPWVSTWVGVPGCPTSSDNVKDGPRTLATIGLGTTGPLAVDSRDRLYFTDGDKLRVVDGDQVKTVAEHPLSYSLWHGLAIVGDDHFLVAARRQIYEVKAAKWTHLAGTSSGGHVDGPAAQAKFEQIYDIAVDDKGRVIIAERRSIRMLANDQVTTLVGPSANATVQDGPLASASVGDVRAVLPMGADVYFADYDTIRMMTAGAIQTVAGLFASGGGVVDGDLVQARFTRLSDLAAHGSTIYMVDRDPARRIRYIKGGKVGSLTNGKIGFKDGPLAEALFDTPQSVAVDGKGDLFVLGTGCKIRKIQLTP